MELKEFLTGVLSKTLNIDENGVASLFNEDGSVKEDAEQTVLNWDAERVKGLKTSSTKQAFDDGFKKAQSEVLTKFENDLKTKTGFKSDKKGIDLVLDYVASQKPADAVTDDAVKKHPLFLTLQEESQKAIEKAKEEGQSALNQFKSEISKKETFAKVSAKILEVFHKDKPILPKDPIKAKKQEELFLNQFKGYDFEEQDGGRIVIMKDGKVVENSQGHALQLEKLVKETASDYYEFHVADSKSSPGNQNTNTGKEFTFEVPKNAEEYAKAISDPSKSLEERQAIDAAYQKSKS